MEQKSKLPYYLGVFLISPALAFFYGIANFKEKAARLILLFFFGAYGFTIIITPGKDSYELSETFKHYIQDLSFTNFYEEIMLILTFRGTHEDEPFMTVLSYIVAQLTSNPDWLFLIVGLIYGFFYIKGVTLVYRETTDKWNLSLTILFIFFISWISLTGINAPRNWTAAWVFFCGAFSYIKTQDFKYLYLVLCAPFIHFAYLLITFPFFIYVFFKDLKYIYLTILIVSYLASASTSFIKPYLETTQLGRDKIEAYIENPRFQEDRMEMESQNLNFHARFYRTASDLSIQFMFICAILFMGYFSGKNHDPFLTGLASVSMLILSFSNIFESIPVVRNRLFINYGNFALAYLVLLYSKNFEGLKHRQWVINICIPAIVLFLFTQYSQFGDFMDFRVLFSPLMYPFFGDDPVSMKAFLKQLLGA